MTVIESVIELLLQKLGEQFIQEALSLRGARDQVELLQAELTRMQYFLKDADAKQEAGDERVKNWVREVRDVAYEAEDVIDTFTFDIATLTREGSVDFIRRYVSFFTQLIDLYKVGSEIERINNKIRRISESRSAYGIQNLGQGSAETSSANRSLPQWRHTSPLVAEPDFVGFKTDLEVLVRRLTEGELRRCVVSVVGMGGLGKTTLTKEVYNDTRVRKHFHSRVWITVSQEYGVRDLLLRIMNCYKRLPEDDLKNMDIFQLSHEISQCLKERRYLIVLDDIWATEAWDALKDAFRDMKNGSRVMLTTRNKDIALHADATSQPHELRFLNNEEGWNLFCKKTFPGQDGGYPQDLEKLGREFVEKCHGLPLAIIVIGGLLSRKEAWEWENVRKTISWHFVEGQPRIYEILSLSYRDLPYHLKPCFLYLGIFPEDCEFSAQKLIRLWAAEGFLQQRENETVEEMGEDCLKELIQRSMIQPAARKLNGGIKSCRIHDLLRDLSISEAKNNKFLQVHCENVDAVSKSTARRLTIYDDALNECTSLESYNPRLRSLLTSFRFGGRFPGRWGVGEKFLYGGFKLLRVLDLNVKIKELPSEIGELIHLRYLGCTNTELESLPLWIGNLHNLQTLIVKTRVTSARINIPRRMEKMQQLRHFIVKSIEHYSSDLAGWGVIEGHPRLDLISNLQTLSYVKAGEWMNGCLVKLTNLRKLAIHLDEEGAYADVLHESIVKMECLQSLTVTGYKFPSSFPFTRLLSLRKLRLRGPLDKLPDSPEFLTKLTYLSLKYSRLNQDPLATLEKLKNLRNLRLFDDSYVGKEMACSAHGFPRLELLLLQRLRELEEWRVEEGAMPTLSHLKIVDCQQLKKLPEELQHVSTLKTLTLYSMPDEFKERLREDGGEDWHKIRHVPSIHIQDNTWSMFN